jgi:hypothetical protein
VKGRVGVVNEWTATRKVMDDQLKKIRDDFLSLMVKLQREGKEQSHPEKSHLAQILAMMAGAIQEGKLESLAADVYQWGKDTLANWKKPDESAR